MSRLITKPTNWQVRPAKTQISLGIRPVWSESSLPAWRNIGSLTTYWAQSEDSDQPRLIWVFAGRTVILVVLSWSETIKEIPFIQMLLKCCLYLASIHEQVWEMYMLVPEAYMSPVKRICVFEHFVMTNFNCACPAIQRGQGSGFLSEGSSWVTAWMRRLAWTFAARIGDKYQIRLTRSICNNKKEFRYFIQGISVVQETITNVETWPENQIK